MILALKTDTPTCELTFIDDKDTVHSFTWEAGRELAKGLLGFIETKLETLHVDWDEIYGIIVFKGPGSFTGLRIGITVANTIAYASNISIVGTEGEDWLENGQARLRNGVNDRLVMPEYGAEPHITKARK